MYLILHFISHKLFELRDVCKKQKQVGVKRVKRRRRERSHGELSEAEPIHLEVAIRIYFADSDIFLQLKDL